MNFINSFPKFKQYQPDNLNFEFYYQGIFDRSIDSIIEELSKGKMPQNLKGNFSFFYKDQRTVIVAVDHLPNYNLFYTDTDVSHIFNSLKTKDSERNQVIAQLMNFTWGGSVGPETNYKHIKRLEAGTCFIKNLETNEFKVESYIDLYTHEIDNTISIGDISSIVENIIEEQTREPFVLFWSSGTDSNCILGFIRKLRREYLCQPVSLYSPNSITDERPHIEYLENAYGIKTQYIDLGKYIGITEEVKQRVANPETPGVYKENYYRTWGGFWYENNIFQKYTALHDLNIGSWKTITGEAGDQLFGSRFGKALLGFITQKPNYTSKEISELFVSSDVFRFNRSFIQRPQQWQSSLESNPNRLNSYETAVNWVEKTWNQLNSEDTINKIELLQYLYKASHRTYNYGQLMNCNFVHPFADYRLFFNVFKTPGHWKIKNGKTRRLSLSIIEDYVNPGPWTWAKSGIQLPSQQTSRINNG